MQRRFLRKRGAAGVPAPPGGAVAQRLRGYKWRSEKSVKAIAPTGAALAFLCFDFFFRIVKGVQPLTTGCGTQHPLRALGGTRVLLAAAPTASPCFLPRAAVVAVARLQFRPDACAPGPHHQVIRWRNSPLPCP